MCYALYKHVYSPPEDRAFSINVKFEEVSFSVKFLGVSLCSVCGSGCFVDSLMVGFPA